MEGYRNFRELLDKSPVIHCNSKEGSDLRPIGRSWVLRDGFHFFWVSSQPVPVYDKAQEGHGVCGEGAFLWLEEKAIISKSLENLDENFDMLVKGLGVNRGIVQVD